MRLTAFILIIACLHVSAKTEAQSVTYSGKEQSLRQIFTEIEKQTGFYVLATKDLLANTKPVSITAKDMRLDAFLDAVFKDQPLLYRIESRNILLSKKPAVTLRAALGRDIPVLNPITGRITDSLGNALAGASVGVVGKAKTTVTDVFGRFSIDAEPGDVLAVSFVGFERTRLKIEAGTTTVTIMLKSLAVQLENFAVVAHTGYQTISKERATGSYAVVSAGDISNKLQTNILSRLEGQVPGFTMLKDTVRIRGTSTLSGVKTPLYVVDGFPYEGSLAAINPWDVESVTMLKDATASSIYGSRSANGVIVITTKRGKAGRTQVDYNGTMRVVTLPDNRSYLNLMNSRELVDFQQQMFGVYHAPFSTLNAKASLNEVKSLLYQREAGTITDAQLNAALDGYRNTDNRQQLIDNFLRKASVTQQHNISFRGGSEKYTYSVSGNYTKMLPFEDNQREERYGYNVKSTYNVFKWLRADLNLLGSYTTSSLNSAGLSGKINNNLNAQDVLNGGRPSYVNLFNANGNPVQWFQGKSNAEITRLIQAGLLDETYYPVADKDKTATRSKSAYNNFSLALNFKILEGLTLDVAYQTEISALTAGYVADKDAWLMRTTINNAAKIDPATKKITYLIPTGGNRVEGKTDAQSYTMRAQLNYNKVIGSKHAITSIAGTEKRAVKNNTNYNEVWGYDDVSLANKYIDMALLSVPQSGTQSLNGSFVYSPFQSFREIENRFVSFYANASYEYNRKYAITGSIRMDQSNLFGTDPKLQYRPLWSGGASWNISSEEFMRDIRWIDNVTLRATYGINGNIAKQTGPYLIAANSGVNTFTGDYQSNITSPPNSRLRWEKTKQTNFGADFSLFKGRLSGSIEYYMKNTSDLLGPIVADPTSGWASLTVNYASLFNHGYELNLSSLNVDKVNFKWTTGLNFAYNKNKVTDLQNSTNAVSDYIGSMNTRIGVPIGALYSIRWAGLDDQGRPQAYKADGKTIVKSQADLTPADLVYSGTSNPPYSGSLTNTFSYKGISLSFMFVYYGGNVMRDIMPLFITNPDGFSTNINRSVMNYWQKAGDENDPSKAPAIYRNASTNIANLWYGADKHIMKADFLKLRDLTLGYELPREWISRLKLSRLSVNTQIQNLWYHAANPQGLDPETWSGVNLSGTLIPGPGSFLTSRTPKTPVTYTVGISASF